MGDLPESYWDQLSDFPSVTIDEAVLLSLGVAPTRLIERKLDAIAERMQPATIQRAIEQFANVVGAEVAAEFIGRRESCSRWACVQVEGGLTTYEDFSLTKPGRSYPHDFRRCRVRIRDFADFCIRQGFEIPEPFANYASPPGMEVKQPDQRLWPWGEHETELLRHMKAAAQKYWVNYDPADSTTAPTNEEVAAYLMQRGVASRVAETMAQILRADGLRPGPRPGARTKE